MDEVIFEVVFGGEECGHLWRVLDPSQNQIGSGNSPHEAIVDAESAMWSAVGEGVEWKRQAVNGIDVDRLPEALREPTRKLLELWRRDLDPQDDPEPAA